VSACVSAAKQRGLGGSLADSSLVKMGGKNAKCQISLAPESRWPRRLTFVRLANVFPTFDTTVGEKKNE